MTKQTKPADAGKRIRVTLVKGLRGTLQKHRESVKGRIGGRTHEISRLIGRSLRASIDLAALGENSIAIDCDVLQADGGTRTAAITGAYVALVDAIEWGRGKGFIGKNAKALHDSIAAISVRMRLT